MVAKEKNRVSKKPKNSKFGEDYVSNSILDNFGDVLKRGTEVFDDLNDLKIMSFSPAVDGILNGGLREGTVVGLAGPPKCGKTTSVLHFAGKCQQAGKQVVYLNSEGRMNAQNFNGVKSLSVEDLIIAESTDEAILSGEKFLTIAETYIKNVKGCVVIIDSLSSLIPECELTGELDAQTRNKLPRLLSQFFKKIGHDVTRNKVILVCVAHQIADTGPSMRTKMTDCGNMFQYQVSTNLVIPFTTRWKATNESEPDIGQKMNWQVLTSNTGGIPNTKVEGWLRYGTGIDEVQEVIHEAAELRVIKVNGAWYTLSCLIDAKDEPAVLDVLIKNDVDVDDDDAVTKFFKFQGAANVREFLDANPNLVQIILEKTREMLI